MNHVDNWKRSLVLAMFAIAAATSAHPAEPGGLMNTEASTAPVLVELFTSESCSSCPPADRLLAQLERSDPSVIVLSEHVTYWNETGWNDPYSSRESTDRQNAYVNKMGLSSSYTPQMVVEGRYEFVGSNAAAANRAIEKARALTPVAVTFSNLNSAAGHVNVSVSTGKLAQDAELFVVVTQDEGLEHVARGENGGHILRHVQIARIIRHVASIQRDEAYQGSLSIDLPQPIAGSGRHLVAFLQQGNGGPILGVTAHGL